MTSTHDETYQQVLKDCMTPLDRLLMNYAAGRLEEQEKLLVTAARALNPDVRSRIAQFEAMGAHLMCQQAPAPVSAACLNAIMARIDAQHAEETEAEDAAALKQQANTGAAVKAMPSPVPVSVPVPDLNIPEIIQALIANVCAHRQQWSHMTRGVMRMELTVRRPPQPAKQAVQKRLRLMKLPPGGAAPRHAHAGTEITLVLEGEFSDELGTFRRGDVVIITDPRFAHAPRAGGEGCTCLTLTEARLRFHDPLARIMNTFWRI